MSCYTLPANTLYVKRTTVHLALTLQHKIINTVIKENKKLTLNINKAVSSEVAGKRPRLVSVWPFESRACKLRVALVRQHVHLKRFQMLLMAL